MKKYDKEDLVAALYQIRMTFYAISMDKVIACFYFADKHLANKYAKSDISETNLHYEIVDGIIQSKEFHKRVREIPQFSINSAGGIELCVDAEIDSIISHRDVTEMQEAFEELDKTGKVRGTLSELNEYILKALSSDITSEFYEKVQPVHAQKHGKRVQEAILTITWCHAQRHKIQENFTIDEWLSTLAETQEQYSFVHGEKLLPFNFKEKDGKITLSDEELQELIHCAGAPMEVEDGYIGLDSCSYLQKIYNKPENQALMLYVV